MRERPRVPSISPHLPLDIPAVLEVGPTLWPPWELTTGLKSPCFFPQENINDQIPQGPWEPLGLA